MCMKSPRPNSTSTPQVIHYPLDINVGVKVSISADNCENITVQLTAVVLWSEGHQVGWSPFLPLSIDFY